MARSNVHLSRHSKVRLRRYLTCGLFVIAALATTATLADPGDFAAMPGLWKIITRTVNHGRLGKPVIAWRCVDEGADPWVEFADRTSLSQMQCKRADEHRRSTALDWSLNCPGNPSSTGKGRVDFDSPEHFKASVTMEGQGEVIRVEGKRYAACTSPSD